MVAFSRKELTCCRGAAHDQSAIELYLTFCNSQPLPLFSHRTSVASISNRDPELVFAVEAAGLRFRGLGVKDSLIEPEIRSKIDRASQLVMNRMADGNVELSTIQTLCILSMLEFTGMKPTQLENLPCHLLTASKLATLFELGSLPKWQVTSYTASDLATSSFWNTSTRRPMNESCAMRAL